MFELSIDLESRCIACGTERDAEGTKIVSGESTWIVQAEEPCDCGETRIKVTVLLGD